MNLLRLFVQKNIELLRPLNVGKFSTLCWLASTKPLISASPSMAQVQASQSSAGGLIKLNPQQPLNLIQTREYKVKTRLRKRCKSCRFVWRLGRIYVECEENPRHKQHHKKSFLDGYDNVAHGYDLKAERAEKEAHAAWKAAVL